MSDSLDDFKAKLAASKARFEQQHTNNETPKRREPPPDLQRKEKPKADLHAPAIIVEPQVAAWSGSKPGKRTRQTTTVDVQRMPPHSVEAEQGVLGSILTDAQFGSKGFATLAEVAAKITPHYFYVPANKTVYETMLHLWRSDTKIDLITFTEYLRDKKLLDSVGGAAFVTSLLSFVPTAANVQWYLDIMIDKMRRREAIADGTALVRSAYGALDDDEFLGSIQRVTNRLLHLGSKNGKFPQMIDAAEFCKDEVIELPPLVIHYLLHQGSKCLLGGNSKGRKTWALMDLALSVASGVDWWGFHTRKGCVCYVNLEIQEAFFRQRVQKICETKNVYPEPGSFYVWNLRGYAKPMSQLIQDLVVFLQQHRFTLIIIDPVYKTLPATHGAENDSAIITQLLNDVESIAVETNAAVLFSSHFSKGDQSEKESVDRVSGSGAWARDPDSVLTMTPHEDQDCFTVEATLRNLAPIRPFVVKWDYPLFVREEEADPAKLKSARGRPVRHVETDVLAEMRDKQWRTVDLQKHCDKECGISRAVFFRLWDALKKTGKVVADADENWRKAEDVEPF